MQEEFIQFVGEIARKDWLERRICVPSVVIAQAIIESGWGTSELATRAYALFGIKKNGWTGKTYVKAAVEQKPDGTYYVVDDTVWRAYEDWEQSIIDHNDYIATRQMSNGKLRYADIIGNGDYKSVCELLKKNGYSTSLTYPQKLLDRINKYNLTRFDEEIGVIDMEIRQCFLTNNRCYKQGKTIVPSGIVVHSTGANNPSLKRYVQPDDGILGKNKYGNHWNSALKSVCVHAFIGKDESGKVRVYQTLPWDMRCWGCGSGKKGSYNNNYIQFEICEDALNDAAYFTEAFNAAIELCAYLCKKYGIPVTNVVSHKEAHAQGYASGHADCDHWLAKFGKNMDWLRSQVCTKYGLVAATEKQPETTGLPYKVKITASALNVRIGAGTSYKVATTVKKNQVYTIVEESNGWGKLKSGAGWISLKYTKKV